MNTLSIRTIVRNAAAVFSGVYGSVTRRAQQAGCSRQTVYDHARQVEQRLQPPAPESPPAEVPIPTPTPSLDRAHPATPGGHRIRHGHQHPSDRRPAPRPPGRGWPRSLDHRSLGRRGRREGQTCPPDSRCGLHPRGPDARGRRDLFWGRPTLVGIEPASMTAVFCENAADRSAETWEEQLAPFDRLEFVISDAARGISKAVSQLAQARREDPRGPDPGARPGRLPHHDGSQTCPDPALANDRGRLGEGGGGRPRSRPVETTRDRRPGLGPVPPARPGAGRPHRSSKPSASKRPGAEPTRRSTCSGPTADSTTAAAPGRDRRGRQGADGCRLVEGPQLPERPSEPELPGPDAAAAGAGRTAGRVA